MTESKKLQFFVVDDDPDVVDFVRSLLEADGHAVSGTISSVSALSDIVEQKPDCVLIDLMMPGTDGLELCKQLSERKELQNTKLVIISAKPYEADRARAYEFGAGGYITKPLNAESFLKKLYRILDDKMELTFWGVRGTLPMPGESSLKYGGNTSCFSIEFSKGQFFIFDAGTGIKALSDHLTAERRHRLEAKVFISHPHWDHINALPFFTPLYIPGNEFEILGASHGNISMRQMISAQMDGIYFPIRLKQFGARVYFRDLEEEDFSMGDGITIKTKLLNHPGKCLGYRVEYKGRSICYVTDNELDLVDSEFYNPFYVKNLTKFIHGADILITDTTYTDEEYKTKIGWGHSCVSRVVDLAHTAEVKQLLLFHHDPDQTDVDIDRKYEAAVALLKERNSATECLAPTEGQIFKI
jgi:phosphoribosyl 1,2-cyclic phosphodiesterase/ActR/RegA family two-component response regulator